MCECNNLMFLWQSVTNMEIFRALYSVSFLSFYSCIKIHNTIFFLIQIVCAFVSCCIFRALHPLGEITKYMCFVVIKAEAVRIKIMHTNRARNGEWYNDE